MVTTPAPATITPKEFNDTLARYSATITAISKANSPPKLANPDVSAGAQMTSEELDLWRLDTLPQTVKSRTKPYLTKGELQMLLNCKMGRGKRRQALPKLIDSNADNTVNSATTAAFAYLQASNTTPPSTEHILAALKILVDPLKGVGPATASYILAVIAPDAVPAFSDEGYKWALYWKTGKGAEGWNRKIKYDVKEYRVYVDKVKALAARLGNGVTAGDVEKVGFVLGKEGADFRPESPAETAARVEASKDLVGLNALDAALGLGGSASQGPSNAALDGVITVPAPTRARQASSASAVNKRKKPDTAGSYGPGVDEVPPSRKRKTKASAPKKGKKTGWVFVGKN